MREFNKVIDGNVLRRFRLFEVESCEEYLMQSSKIFNQHRIKVLSSKYSFNSRMDHFPVGPISINSLNWTAPIFLDSGLLDSYYLISYPISRSVIFKHGSEVYEVHPGDFAIAGGGQSFWLRADPGFDQLLIYIPRVFMEVCWFRLTGENPRTPIIFNGIVPEGSPCWRALMFSIQSILSFMDRPDCPQQFDESGLYLAEMLVGSLLLSQRQSMNARERSRPVPSYFDRARKILSNSLEQRLPVSDLAKELGVSARTLQLEFRKNVGMGPVQWFRERRLIAVRKSLEENGRTARITDVALQFQFNHLGEFSRLYREHFGELPKDTVARVKKCD